jgi:hypothetical protein
MSETERESVVNELNNMYDRGAFHAYLLIQHKLKIWELTPEDVDEVADVVKKAISQILGDIDEYEKKVGISK